MKTYHLAIVLIIANGAIATLSYCVGGSMEFVVLHSAVAVFSFLLFIADYTNENIPKDKYTNL